MEYAVNLQQITNWYMMKRITNYFLLILVIGTVLTACKKEDDPTPNPPAPVPQQPVVDIDGNSYPTVKIGNQVWMKENLKVTKLNDNTPIARIEQATSWSETTEPAYCWYNNSSQMGEIYGALYNWYTVETEKLCPTGWRVPTTSDWDVLRDHLGEAGIAGGKMKATGTTHWESPNSGATNESGFTGLPGGMRFSSGTTFSSESQIGSFWTSTENPNFDGFTYIKELFHDNSSLYQRDVQVRMGLSVRCIKN